MTRLFLVTVAAALLLTAAILVLGVTGGLAASCGGQIVTASWYGAESGNRTASGLYFDGTQMIVAHKTLPFGTKLRITYRGKSVIAKVEDRGPFIAGRTLDLSRAVAAKIGMIPAGVGKVCFQIL